jgi:glycosyltransferase involved in cell wall biosynthesis
MAPVVSGTGIKTKVLEAMALGMPVLATPEAVAGLNVQHKNHCFVCARPAEFAQGVRYVADTVAAQSMGLAARDYVRANFSSEVLRGQWRGVMRHLASARPDGHQRLHGA